MPKLTIDNREVEVPAGATILAAARKLGIPIPTLCYFEGAAPHASCLVCVVRVHGLKRLVPACSYPVRDGLIVESETAQVHEARRMALELLMGEHLGDCVGPCVSICPAHLDIPRMLEQIQAGRLGEALVIAKESLALPAILGYVCPAPCEGGCRRAAVDAAVSIRRMHRFAAETDLAGGKPYLPACAPASGKKVAIIGSGPAGLSAAWYLLQQGHACTLYDDRDEPGGMLRYGVPVEKLPRAVLDGEIALVQRLGARFEQRRKLGRDFSLTDLRKNHSAVLLACGELPEPLAAALGLQMAGRGLKVHGHVVGSHAEGTFAAGAAISYARFAVRAVGSGRSAAQAIGQYLSGKPIAAAKEFVVHMGKLDPEELELFLAGVNRGARLALPAGAQASPEQARQEAARCLQCGCLKEKDCRLREWAAEYGVQAAKYKGERRRFERETTHPEVVYERGKCITCGKCLQTAARAGEEVGLAFVARGYGMRVAVPFGGKFSDGLRRSARAAAEACPTGALADKPHAVPPVAAPAAGAASPGPSGPASR